MTDAFSWIEPACVAVIALWLGLRFRRGSAQGAALARDYALLAVASWVAEDTCIRLYGFYHYAPGWHLALDRTPVLIAAIWPVVILSARDLGVVLAGPGRRGVLAGAGIVLLDATLIECVATSTGLWSWTVPGPFAVPLVGIAGWACFALVALAALDGLRGAARLALPLVAPLGTHALLLAAWWSAFRWFAGPVPDLAFAAAVAAVCAGLAGALVVWRRLPVIATDELLSRMAAAGVFFALLAAYHRDDGPLLLLGLGFGPPWGALTVRSWRAASEGPVER